MMRSTDVLARLGGDEFTMLLDRLHGSAEAIVDRRAGRRVVRRSVRGRRAGRSTSPRASASRRTSTPPTTPRRCCRTPTPRSTGPSRAAGTASRCSTSSCAPRSSAGSTTSRSCATRSRRTRSSRGSSPRSICAPAGSSARRRSPAGRTRSAGVLDAGSSCRSPRRPASCSRSTTRSCASAVAGARRARGRRHRRRLPDLVQRLGAASSTRGVPDRAARGAARTHRLRPEPDRARDHRDRDPSRREAAAAREIAAARELGIKVALDDFGTGHSSLTLLRSLPIDRVKIDQTFVRELTRDARDDGDRAQRHHARQRPRARRRRRRGRDAPSRPSCSPSSAASSRAGLPLGEGAARSTSCALPRRSSAGSDRPPASGPSWRLAE